MSPSFVTVVYPLLLAGITWTMEGGFLFGCLLLAFLLVLAQVIVATIEALKAKAAAAKVAVDELKDAAAKVKSAAEGVEHAAGKNMEAAKVGLDAATAHRNLNDTSDNARVEEEAKEAKTTADHASKAAADAKEKADEAAKTAQEKADATLFGAVQSVTVKLPLVGGALIFVLLGGLGAGLIKFAVGG
ncbi:hypothetical protein [Nocardioides astragali]|uniref:Uncharacterized protein n=1 Tax=Nocardioides astragali TaxID=1776736 RepID=A0ABW2N5C1_9ACTN|nr:hypothetical protein [Nocardioides astragali]